MRITTTKALATTAALTLALGTAAAVAGDRDDDRRGGNGGDRGNALDVVGLVGGLTLVAFDTDEPSAVTTLSTVTGTDGSPLIGIDYRVQDGKLYGVSRAGLIYSIVPATGVATLANTSAVPLDASGAYDIDFNPAANALRILSAGGQNLRVPFAAANAATVVDTALTRPVVPATTPPSNEPALGLTGAAYTNNDLDAATGNPTATTLFDLDTARDQVTVQSPANSGLTAATGSLGVDLALDSGFDIHSKIRNGKAVDLRALAVSNGVLYTIDLLSGDADAAGSVPGVTDLAIPLDQL